MGKLAAALDSQLASDNPQALGSPVRIGLTFVGGGGGYCRTFSAVRADSLSGIACRRDGEWRLRMTSAPEGRQADAADYRMAGADDLIKIGRAAGRERECQYVEIAWGAVSLKKKQM